LKKEEIRLLGNIKRARGEEKPVGSETRQGELIHHNRKEWGQKKMLREGKNQEGYWLTTKKRPREKEPGTISQTFEKCDLAGVTFVGQKNGRTQRKHDKQKKERPLIAR